MNVRPHTRLLMLSAMVLLLTFTSLPILSAETYCDDCLVGCCIDYWDCRRYEPMFSCSNQLTSCRSYCYSQGCVYNEEVHDCRLYSPYA
jgi:hypothetical protein